LENLEIAKVLYEIADILEILGKPEDRFRVVSYREAARTIEAMTRDLKSMSDEEIDAIPGVGESILAKIKELLKTGKLEYLEKLRKKISPGFLELMQVPGLGPSRIKILHKKLKVESVKDLEAEARRGRIAKIPGFGKKTEENILRGIAEIRHFKERYPLGQVYPFAEAVACALRESGTCEKVALAGSIRRFREDIGDIDILVTSKTPRQAIDFFVRLPQVQTVLAKGVTKATVVTKIGIHMDLRVVKPEQFGSALYYFTGSKDHSVHLRAIANQKGYSINEYGVYKLKAGKLGARVLGKRVAGRTEEEIFAKFGMPFIVPELRENRGEIEAALSGKLPRLIEFNQIKGDLHLHTKYSDGSNTVAEMAEKAKELGYEYIAITDHSRTVGVTGGIAVDKIKDYLKKVREEAKKIHGIKILAGMEVDIRKDGTLDVPDRLLREMDIVVASVHTSFAMPEAEMTKRVIKAMQNKYLNVLAHPTGRLIGEREGYKLDLDAVMRAARELGVFLELNAFWSRLDLNDVNCRKAVYDYGLKIIINTDSHNTGQMENMRFGVATARRGWLRKNDVINTLSFSEFMKALKRN